METLTVAITGATGNIGGKLRAYLAAQGGYDLRLLDLDPRGDAAVHRVDLRTYDARWPGLLKGVDVVVHLAANGDSDAPWGALIGPNVDAVLNLYVAAQRFGVRRVVFASSVWAMSARFDDGTAILASAPEPGANAYGASKAFGERVGQAFATLYGIETVALRLGACGVGANEKTSPVPAAWEDGCWLSNADACHGIERAIRADVDGFIVVNLTSANPGSPWSLTEARHLLGYDPKDGYPPSPSPPGFRRPDRPLRRLYARMRQASTFWRERIGSDG